MTNFYQSLVEAFKKARCARLILRSPDWSYGDLTDRVNQLAQVYYNEVEPVIGSWSGGQIRKFGFYPRHQGGVYVPEYAYEAELIT